MRKRLNPTRLFSSSVEALPNLRKVLKHAAKMRANNVRDPEIVETLVRAAVEITLAGDPKFENACHFFDAIQVLLGAYHDFGRYDPRAGGMSNLGVRWRAMLEADE